MTKLMICLLTSSRIDFLHASYNSVLNQKTINIPYDIFIIVNTTNDDYYQQVYHSFQNANIIRTESNGKPGKGHNSVIRFFSNNPDYDFLFMLDGDDFLYPSALQHIESYIHIKNPLLLMLMYTDTFSFKLDSTNISHLIINNNAYLLYNFNSIMDSKWEIAKSKNPFQNKIYDLNTMGRIILFSRDSLQYNIHYDENCFLYDDFYPSMQFLELAYLNKNVFRTSDSKIYLYNQLNFSSQTINFDNEKFIREHQIFSESIKDKFQNISDWDLTKIQFITIDNDTTFTFKDKVLFATMILSTFNFEHFIEENKENYDIFIDFVKNNSFLHKEYQFLLDFK